MMGSLAEIEARQVRAVERGDDEEWSELEAERTEWLVQRLKEERALESAHRREKLQAVGEDWMAEPDF